MMQIDALRNSQPLCGAVQAQWTRPITTYWNFLNSDIIITHFSYLPQKSTPVHMHKLQASVKWTQLEEK
jgi:hypothetical protein